MIEALIRAAATKLVVDRNAFMPMFPARRAWPHDAAYHAASVVAYPHVWHLCARRAGAGRA